MANKTSQNSEAQPNQVDIQDIENQIIMIWEKNRGLILGGIGFVFAVFIGYQGLKFMEARAEKNLQEGYQSADNTDAKATWAEDEAGTALSGFAYKELGDEAFAAGDYAKAETYYRSAAESTETPVDQAATMALAVTLIAQDKNAEAKEILQPIAEDSTALAQAEAKYRLASLVGEEGDVQTALDLIDSIDEQDFFWKSRGDTLKEKLPEA
ncbi:tetratricopeptide repeat protein [Pelagicoccus albus]|uniref:Tetratricopeptide repeat protein n=1 Tax=Pelagicoccus albus TaxID=415222 RepID=A0A7X1B863_9BACT|nr:tetratricopeptide repeat protein [Pelagicoccus albus]MBC2607164.1 tetratricopeptide repeat protein [Pelagicoccus albus]